MDERQQTTSAATATACPYCGMIHAATCPKVKAIEYHADGITVKRVEFFAPNDYHKIDWSSPPFPLVNT